MTPRATWYVAAAALGIGAIGWGTGEAWSRHRLMRARPIRVDHAYVAFTDTLGRRETIVDVLARGGIVGRDRTAFLSAATGLPVRRLRPGLVFQFRRLQTDSVADHVSVRLSPEHRVRLARGDAGWTQELEDIPWVASRLRVSGVITTSLYDALDNAVADTDLPAAERRTLAWGMADVYDWQVDFTRDVHPGDRFAVLLERLESPTGERRVGRILSAEVNTGKTANYAFYFASDSATRGYFDDQARSLKRAFLRAPLQFRRISSGFGERYHPILHIWRNHEGVDFSAAYGTPVRATADGVVARLEYEEGGYGNFIELRHANGIRTRYGHLSSYARGLHTGQRVQQGETIGYVGSTGLSTGPHLHYEFLVNGHATNPRRKDTGVGAPIPTALRPAYDSVRTRLQAELETPAGHTTVAARVD